MLKHMSKYSWIKEEITTEISKCYAFVSCTEKPHSGKENWWWGPDCWWWRVQFGPEGWEPGEQRPGDPCPAQTGQVHLLLPCGPIRSSLDWMSGSSHISGRWIFFSWPPFPCWSLHWFDICIYVYISHCLEWKYLSTEVSRHFLVLTTSWVYILEQRHVNHVPHIAVWLVGKHVELPLGKA